MKLKEQTTLDLGSEHDTYSFVDTDGIDGWIRNELAFYQKLQQAAQQRTYYSVIAILADTVALLGSKLSGIKGATPETLDALVEGFTRNLQQYYKSKKLFSAGSPKGRFVSRQFKINPNAGMSAFVYFVGAVIQVGEGISTDAIAGVSRAVNFDSGSVEGSHAINDTMMGILGEQQTCAKQVQSEVTRIVREAEVMRGTLLALLESTTGLVGGKTNSFDKAIKEAIEKARKDLENLTETYDTHMGLKAPVDYWRKKRKAHVVASVCWGVVLALCFIGVIVLPFRLLPGWFEEQSPGTTGATTLPALIGIVHTPTWKLSCLVVIAVVAVWLMRLLSRLMLSQIHLANDAAHRSILLETYLSLERKGDVTTGERELLLKSIMRQASTGIIRDDGMPPSALGLIAGPGKG